MQLADKKEIDNIALEIANKLFRGDIVLLFGELGSGKTFFTKCLCSHIGVKEIVNSPSYVLLNEYLATKGNYPIYHYDLYRLSSCNEAIEIGILERIKDGITIIEWAEIVSQYLPQNRYEIYLKNADSEIENSENIRMINVCMKK